MISDVRLVKIVESYVELEKLDILSQGRDSDVTDINLCKIGQHCRKLKDFRPWGCIMLTDIEVI